MPEIDQNTHLTPGFPKNIGRDRSSDRALFIFGRRYLPVLPVHIVPHMLDKCLDMVYHIWLGKRLETSEAVCSRDCPEASTRKARCLTSTLISCVPRHARLQMLAFP